MFYLVTFLSLLLYFFLAFEFKLGLRTTKVKDPTFKNSHTDLLISEGFEEFLLPTLGPEGRTLLILFYSEKVSSQEAPRLPPRPFWESVAMKSCLVTTLSVKNLYD